MTTTARKMLTVVVESAIERAVLGEMESAGVRGSTIVEARGFGDHGPRFGDWEQNRSVRIETVCTAAMAESLAARLVDRWGKDYALVVWLQDVEVLRGSKFDGIGGAADDI